MKKREYVYLLHLVHRKAQLFEIKTVESEVIPFASEEVAINWLIKHGFVFGQCDEFDNEEGEHYWFHIKDTARDYICVSLEKVRIFDKASTYEEVPDWIWMRKFANLHSGSLDNDIE